MGFAILLLGLVPLMFLPDMVGTPADEGETDEISPDENDDLLTDAPVSGVDSGILPPIDEDDAPDDGNQPVDPDSILAPVDEDDTLTPSDGNEGEVLQPVDEIETEMETIYLDAGSDAGLGYSEIEDFAVGQDILHISIPPEMVTDDLDVEVIPTDDGEDAMVFVEHQLFAILKDAPEANEEDVVVVIERLAA